MQYSDTTVIIPIKNEPAVVKVAKDIIKNMPACKVVVIYKGYLDSASKSGLMRYNNLSILKQKDDGKGAACIYAAKFIRTPIIGFIDGDDTYSAADLKRAINLVKNGVDMVVGDRLSRLQRRSMPHFIEFGNKVLSVTSNILYGVKINDTQTGLRALKKSVFDSLDLKEKHFGIETELNVKVGRKGFQIKEIPIKYNQRIGSSKQVKFIDGIKLFFITLKFLFAK